jgi:hypothetical protein
MPSFVKPHSYLDRCNFGEISTERKKDDVMIDKYVGFGSE